MSSVKPLLALLALALLQPAAACGSLAPSQACAAGAAVLQSWSGAQSVHDCVALCLSSPDYAAGAACCQFSQPAGDCLVANTTAPLDAAPASSAAVVCTSPQTLNSPLDVATACQTLTPGRACSGAFRGYLGQPADMADCSALCAAQQLSPQDDYCCQALSPTALAAVGAGDGSTALCALYDGADDVSLLLSADGAAEACPFDGSSSDGGDFAFPDRRRVTSPPQLCDTFIPLRRCSARDAALFERLPAADAAACRAACRADAYANYTHCCEFSNGACSLFASPLTEGAAAAVADGAVDAANASVASMACRLAAPRLTLSTAGRCSAADDVIAGRFYAHDCMQSCLASAAYGSSSGGCCGWDADSNACVAAASPLLLPPTSPQQLVAASYSPLPAQYRFGLPDYLSSCETARRGRICEGTLLRAVAVGDGQTTATLDDCFSACRALPQWATRGGLCCAAHASSPGTTCALYSTQRATLVDSGDAWAMACPFVGGDGGDGDDGDGGDGGDGDDGDGGDGSGGLPPLPPLIADPPAACAAMQQFRKCSGALVRDIGFTSDAQACADMCARSPYYAAGDNCCALRESSCRVHRSAAVVGSARDSAWAMACLTQPAVDSCTAMAADSHCSGDVFVRQLAFVFTLFDCQQACLADASYAIGGFCCYLDGNSCQLWASSTTLAWQGGGGAMACARPLGAGYGSAYVRQTLDICTALTPGRSCSSAAAPQLLQADDMPACQLACRLQQRYQLGGACCDWDGTACMLYPGDSVRLLSQGIVAAMACDRAVPPPEQPPQPPQPPANNGTNSTTAPEPTPTPKKPTPEVDVGGSAVGGTVGGSVAAAVVAALLLGWWWRRRSGNSSAGATGLRTKRQARAGGKKAGRGIMKDEEVEEVEEEEEESSEVMNPLTA